MIILRTAGTFFLLLISFSLMWLYVYGKMKDWRSSFVVSFLFFGVYVWLSAEILSFFELLFPLGILCGWIGYIVIVLICLVRSYKKGELELKMPTMLPLQWEYIALGIILSVTFFIAIAYPPSNWDSMAYHLPRIEHWLQNKNLNHYYTSIDRQLFSAPFAEILILHGRALSGDDYLVNLVQWFSFAGSIMAITKIVGYLGLDREKQIVAALFFATVPMAILQASSTQTDLVETFCIICLVERLLAWRKTGTIFESLTFGLALGLSVLTKGTAYPIAFPFVVYFLILCIKHFRQRLIGGALAALLCLSLNAPHYARNYMVFHNPLGVNHGTMSNLSAKSLVITFLSNIYANVDIPVPYKWLDPIAKKLNISSDNLWNLLRADDSVFPNGRPGIAGIWGLAHFREDYAKNLLHIILVIIAFILLPQKKSNVYGLLVIGSWCMFAFFIPWQAWITRLQLPLFALSAPVFSSALEKKDRFRKLSVLMLVSFALLPLTLNKNRPLLPIPGITSSKALWNTSRDDLVFIDRHSDGTYSDACAAVVQANTQNLGIIIGADSWEYPLWHYIRKNSDHKIAITHVKEEAIDSNIDALFILSHSLTNPISMSLNQDIPLVLKRNIKNQADWEIIYK